jgi:hypothetical protein
MDELFPRSVLVAQASGTIKCNRNVRPYDIQVKETEEIQQDSL